MTKQEKLIERYENHLQKVIKAYEGDCRFERYIESATQDLEAVKNGRQW